MFSKLVLLLSLTAGSIATILELAPTDQTVFDYPANGSGIGLPFPAAIATLTGLTDWPTVWELAPFTPNMAKLYNPSATAVIADIVTPPAAAGPLSKITPLIFQTFAKRLTMVQQSSRLLSLTISAP
jgi:hypothetical protein